MAIRVKRIIVEQNIIEHKTSGKKEIRIASNMEYETEKLEE